MARGTNNTMARRTNNIMARKTNNTMARKTNNTMARETNNDLQNTTLKANDRAKRTSQIAVVELGCSGRVGCPCYSMVL
jgi:hypothetical protein